MAPRTSERLRRVATPRRLEGADAVRDRLDAGERGGAGREGADDDEHADGPDARRDGVGHLRLRAGADGALATPVATSAYMATTNAYVGRAKRMPDSRTPRRFASVRRTMKASERLTLCDSSEGTADVRASTPAATETATVRT